MAPGQGRRRAARTLLEELIWQHRQTLEEFTEYAESFARQHGEPGTLSVRHLKRLAAGCRSDGTPLGRPRQVTTRLLERIFNQPINVLLAPREESAEDRDSENELRDRLRASARVDASTLTLLGNQLDATRRLDRQFGALVAHEEVLTKIEQVTPLLRHCLTTGHRQGLAEHLSELSALAGWQALDMGLLTDAWRHHERGKAAAKESDNVEFEAHTSAEQAFVLVDLGQPGEAVEALAPIRATVAHRSGRLVRAWLAAAHGEALAAAHQRSACLQAFDEASSLLPEEPHWDGGAYVALNSVHLARWRGHALARVGAPEAVDVLTSALAGLDPTFVRAEASLHVDLATAQHRMGEHERAQHHAAQAHKIAESVGSVRQRRRVQNLQTLALLGS